MTLTLPEVLSVRTATGARTVLFEPGAHLDEILSVLGRIAATEPGYPPVRPAHGGGYMYAEWLTGEPTVGRWAGMLDGALAGYAAAGPVHPYLTDGLTAAGERSIASSGFLEISKIFAAPEARGRGLGRALFSAARMHAWASAQQPVLAVPETATEARRFFTAQGMADVGGAEGHFGPVRILVDPAPPWFISSW